MITKGGTKGDVEYTLTCDYCEDTCDEVFDMFEDAINYKTNRDNGWASVRDQRGEWWELCPSCNKPEIIAQLKGVGTLGRPRDDLNATDMALEALEEGK